MHHKKTDLKVFFIVKPKEGWVHMAFFGYDNDKDLQVCFLVTHVYCRATEFLSFCGRGSVRQYLSLGVVMARRIQMTQERCKLSS